VTVGGTYSSLRGDTPFESAPPRAHEARTPNSAGPSGRSRRLAHLPRGKTRWRPLSPAGPVESDAELPPRRHRGSRRAGFPRSRAERATANQKIWIPVFSPAAFLLPIYHRLSWAAVRQTTV
jgi:hypothetical protein